MLDHLRRMSLLALAVGLLTGLGVVAPDPAGAHAALVGSDPAEGASLTAPPATITLRFSENVGTADVALTAPDGSQVDVSGITAVDDRVTAAIATVDQRGTYSASYRVVSADGHPIADTFSYTVTTGRTVEQVEQTTESTFLHRHRSHLIWGILAAVIAIALLLAPLRRRDDADRS